MIKLRHSILVALLLLGSFSYGQTETEMQAQADKLFNNEQYLEATPLYLRLLALQASSTNYNYKYGACLLYNSNKKSDAIKYLKYGVSDPAIAPEAYYFLGKAYHLNYQFGEAIKNYTTYNQQKAQATKKFDADREIQMCNNGKNLMTTISDLIVVDKKEIQTDKFFRVYDLQNIGGSMLVTTEFQSKLDKKYNHTPVVHFPQNPSVIYYSSYGETEGTGKDIYVRRRLPSGTWGEPQKIPGGVNTKFDEDFPYMHPDGRHLYFSSKGHNSMGGYDVFQSTFDAEENTYSTPENMDFAISSPDDDMFYVVDSLNKNAYFGSARQSQEGKLFVYKVIVERVPIQLAVVKGNFISQVNPSNKRVDIEIRDVASGNSIGKYNSNDKAVYLLTFPKGGKYEYIIKIDGGEQEYRAMVSIPFLKEFKPLKQKIIHTVENGVEVVKVVDLFNEEVEDPQGVLAEVLKARSDLNINVEEFDIDELERNKQNELVLAQLGFGNLSLVEVKERLQTDVINQESSVEEAKQMQENVNAIVVQNSDFIEQIDEAIKKKVAEASKVATDDEKYQLLKEAELLHKKQEELKAQSTKLFALADSIQNVLNTGVSIKKIPQLKELSDQYNQLVAANKKEEAVQLLVDNKSLLNAFKEDPSIHLKENLIEKIILLDNEQLSVATKIGQYDKELREIDAQIEALEQDRLVAKKKDLTTIDAQIASKREEIAMIRIEREKLARREERIVADKAKLAKQVDLIDIARNNIGKGDVSREIANISVQKANSTNSKTLNNFVNQQIAELEKKDPTLIDRVVINENQAVLVAIKNTQNTQNTAQNKTNGGNQGINTSDEVAKKKVEVERFSTLKNGAEQEKQTILRNAQLTVTERNQAERNLNEKTIASIDKQLASVSSEEVKADLVKLKLDLSERNKILTKENPAIVTNENQTDKEEIERFSILKNGAEQEKQTILRNTQLTVTERNQAERNLNEKTIASIDKQLLNTSNSEVKADLEKLKLDLSERNKILAKENPAIVTNENQTDKEEIERFSILKNVAEQEKQTILRNTQLTAVERIQAERNLNEKTIASIDKQLASVSSDEVKADLVKLKLDLSERNKVLAQESNTIAATETPIAKEEAQRFTSLKNGFEQERQKIERNGGSNANERNQAERNLNDKTIEAIDNQISMATDAKVKEDLARLKSDLTARNEALIASNNAIVSNESNPINEVQLAEELKKTYLSDKQKIDNNTSLSKNEKFQQEKLLNEKLLRAIDEQLAAAKDPAVITELKDWRTTVVSQIEQLNFAVEFDENLSDNSKSIIDEINKNYNKTSEEVQNNTALTKEEKNRKMQQLDNELLTGIDEKVKTIDQAIAKSPNDLKLKEEKERLENLRSIVESKIEERNQMSAVETFAGLTEQQIETKKQDLMLKIDASYPVKKEQFTRENKTSALIDLNNSMKEKVLVEIAKAEKQLKANPNNQSALEQKLLLEKIITELAIENKKYLADENTVDPSIITQEDKEQLWEQVGGTTELAALLGKNLNETTEQQLEDYKEKIGDVQANIIARRQTAQDDIKENPNDLKTLKEIKILDELKLQIDEEQKRIEDELQERTKAQENQTFTVAEVNLKIKEINPQLEQQLQVVEDNQSTTELEKAQERDRLLHEALEKVLDKQLAVEQELNNDLSNASLKSESKLLDAAVAQLEKEIRNNEKEIADITANNALVENGQNTKELTVASVENELIPGIAENKLAIQNDESLPEDTKKMLLTQLEEAMIQKADERVQEIQNELTNDPKNATLLQEKTIVEQIKTDAEKNIVSLKEEAVSTTTSKDLVSRLAPDYFDKIEALKAENVSFERINKQLVIENDLLNKLLTEQKKVEKALKKNPTDAALKQDSETLSQLVKSQNETIESLESKRSELLATPENPTDLVQETKFIDDLRSNLLGENKSIVENLGTTEQELKFQQEQLLKYEQELNKEIDETKVEIKENPSDKKLPIQLAWLEAELATVKKQLRQASIEIGELTQVAVETSDNNSKNPELAALTEKQEKLVEQLASKELSNSERKSIEKEISVVEKQKVAVEENLLKTEIASNETILNQQVASLSKAENTAEVKLVAKEVKSEYEQSQALIAQANESKGTPESVQLLKEAQEHQEKAKEIADNAQFDQKMVDLANQFDTKSLNSKEDLERKKRQYIIEIGELTQVISALDQSIQTADKKEVEALKEERANAAVKKSILERALMAVDEQLAAQIVVNETLPTEAKKVSLTFNEEREIASTEEYNNYVAKANEALLLEKKVSDLEQKANALRSEIKQLVGESDQVTEDQTQQALIETKVKELKSIDAELSSAKKELQSAQLIANQSLPTNNDDAMKMINLMRRAIAPINKIAIAAALVPMPANGLDIKAEGINMYSETNKIPVDVSSPKGLVYRVQIGAFAKAIDQNKFKEFNPVSGELLTNGITRYMAGYFNSSGNVMEALGKVKDLGYADAFPVAYCDGKRINLAEARRLEASGECVAKGSNEMMIEVAAITAVAMGLEDTTKLKKVPEYTYNQAPGAAKAEAIELKKGLFFTVQIGVYNKPVSSATLFNLNPYMSLRLPNGQIRYSTGIFHSVEEARPRKGEAIEKGVKDAFITAYFNGERIPINDALALLAAKGTTILESKEGVKAATTELSAAVQVNTNENRNIPVEVKIEKPQYYYQIVSKASYSEFPVEVLNRYNGHGSFYYDEQDKKVKSAIVDDEDALPQVHYFKDDVEKITMLPTSKNLEETMISFNFDGVKLPGDLTDWLMRINHRKAYFKHDESLEVRIYGVDEEKTMQLKSEATLFDIEIIDVKSE